MDMFEKSNEHYEQNGLFIESRQLSWVVSVLLIFGFFIFWAGYFLGQKKVLAQFAQKIEDRLPLQQERSELTQEATDLDAPSVSYVGSSDKLATVQPEVSPSTEYYKPIDLIIPKEHYYAYLASFDSQEEAETLVARLKTCNIATSVKERCNETDSGSEQVWYQVVTDLFENKDELVLLVNNLIKQEKLRDICYVCC